MSPPDATIAVQEHLLQDSESSDQKPRLAAGDDEIQQDGATQPQKLQRYWVRTIVLILVPAIITAWYGIIWVALVLGIEHDEVVKYRTYDGSMVFYSWFIIGVFGLAWGKYGLVGVEVAMLQTPFWKAPNMVVFLMHSNTTWNSPSGWLSAIRHRQFHRLWCLLTFLSILPFIAFPLSGMTWEISDGYIQTSTHPFVVGRNVSTFTEVYTQSFEDLADNAWLSGSTPTIPGFGVVYTPPGLDRTKHPSLGRVPNILPLADAIPDMFLAPQADVPVSGKAWGLRVKYDCPIVRDASEFTILSQKHQSTLDTYNNYTDASSPFITLQTPGGESIDIFSTGYNIDSLYNLWAYSEMGYRPQLGKYSAVPNRDGKYISVPQEFASNDGYNTTVFEYAIWQYHFQDHYDRVENKTSFFNHTIGHGVAGMGSPYVMSENKLTVNGSFWQVRAGGNFTEVVAESGSSRMHTHTEPLTDLRDIYNTEKLTKLNNVLHAAEPIGVRCVVSSGVGTATLDGVTSTFNDFQRSDPKNDEMELLQAGPYIFGYTAFRSLTKRFEDLYDASHYPPTVPRGNVFIYTAYIHANALQQAVMLAFGLDALQLMYQINPAPERAWVNPDLWASEEGKILSVASLIPGTAVGYLVLALFCIWSVLSAALGIVYGFRKRSSDKLDGESVFWRGVDMSEDVKQHNSGKPFYANKKLQALPGVGGSRQLAATGQPKRPTYIAL